MPFPFPKSLSLLLVTVQCVDLAVFVDLTCGRAGPIGAAETDLNWKLRLFTF